MDFVTKFNQFMDAIAYKENQLLVVQGLWITLKIAIVGLIIGIVLGIIVGFIGAAQKNNWVTKVINKFCQCYVAVFRGTPIVVQLLVVYYVIPSVFGLKNIDSELVAIVVFGLNSGAYVSEIMRGGLNSVDPGQMEAGRSLGMSYSQTMLRIVIPQAIKNILPTLGNEFITLLKETSVVNMIGVFDICNSLLLVASTNYDKIIPYFFMAIIYIILVLLISALIKILEKSLGKSDRRTTSLVEKKTFFGLKIGGGKA